MNTLSIASRFLLPRHFVSIYYFWKFRCIVSPRAEVDLNENIKIGKKSRISSFAKIKSAHGPVEIGERVDVSPGCFLSGCAGGLIIGDDCLIGPNSVLLSNSYHMDDLEMTFRDQGIKSIGTTIGKNVLIGANAVVHDGSTIGDGVVIAPNSSVSGDIPSNSVAQGNPAKVIFTRR